MKELRRRYLSSAKFYLFAYAILYFLPVLMWYRVTSKRFPTVSGRVLVIYSAVMLAVIVTDAVTRYARFMRQVRGLTPGELERLVNSLGNCPSYKTPLGMIYLADGALYYTGGHILPYPEIEEIELRTSETDTINVHHIYIHCRDRRRRYIPATARTLPESFDAEIKKKNSGIEVNRTFKPAFGRKRNTYNKENTNEK